MESGLAVAKLLKHLGLALLAVIIFGYIGLAQIDPSDPAADKMVRQALPYLLAVNHLSLFGLLLLGFDFS